MKTNDIHNIVRLSLREDMGGGDITTNALIDAKSTSTALIIFKSKGVLCGMAFAKAVFQCLDSKISFKSLKKDGDYIVGSQAIAVIKGKTRAILTGERVALNFLCYLSSIATNTSHYVSIIKPYKAHVLDTRKTTPTLRWLERYAVKTGGGYNHRFNLNDMVMIKDNHYSADKNPSVLVQKIKRKTSKLVVLEVDTLEQLLIALQTKADIILLDNMNPAMTKKAVQLRNKTNPKILLESSGGIRLNNIKQYAACGVERISIGALTQTRLVIDIGLDIQTS